MSSILKALKKLEEEQAGRPPVAVGAGGQFVAPPRAGRRTLLLLAAGTGAGLLLAGGLYLLLGDRSELPPAAAPVSLQQNPAGFAGPAASTSALPAVKPAPPSPQKTAPAAKAVVPAAGQGVTTRPVAILPSKTAQAVTPTPPAVADKITTAVNPGSVEQIQVERREIPAPGQQWAAAHLSVTGILPDSGGGRMAIVNDLPVMEGTMVDNALVKEIQADRVWFVIDGKSVVVPLTSPR